MKKKITVVIEKGNLIRLPEEVINCMDLRDGDQLQIEYANITSEEKCFYLTDDNDEQIFNEGYYCVPTRLLQKVGLEEEDLQILLNDEEILITSSSSLIGSMPKEYITAMLHQDVNFKQLADDVVEEVNRNVLEEEEGE